MIQVKKITDKEDQKIAYKIREEVFVIEQEVAPEEEYDEYEEISRHFLAYFDGEPCGTARWRYKLSADGKQEVKLERFAVRKPFRGKQVGSALVEAVLQDVKNDAGYTGQSIYLHAQLPAIPLYEKFNFRKEGEMFVECNIRHYTMRILS